MQSKSLVLSGGPHFCLGLFETYLPGIFLSKLGVGGRNSSSAHSVEAAPLDWVQSLSHHPGVLLPDTQDMPHLHSALRYQEVGRLP